MAIFTAIYSAIAGALYATAIALGIGGTLAVGIAAYGSFALTAALGMSLTRLVIRTLTPKAPGRTGNGSRVQLPPATDNKIPVVYGRAYVGSAITDAYISPDLKTMYYVCAISEYCDTTPGSTITFGDIYYDNKLVTFDGVDGSKVISLTNNSDPVQVDTKINGFVNIWLYSNGSDNPYNTATPAYNIMPTWTSDMSMDNCAFAIIRVKYSTDAGTTNLGGLQVELINSVDRPGDVFKDYMLNARYGCGIPPAQINDAAITALNDYSDELITYVPVEGGTATQERYRINGPISTGDPCLTNLQLIADACDSWLQYNEITGQWTPVINQSYTDYTTTASLFVINSDNLVSGIDINPIDLNETFNSVEVKYPNTNIRDQVDIQKIELSTFAPEVLSPNEPDNKLVVELPLVNNAVQAKYLALRKLLQSREDLIITYQTDYNGIQVSAGDVVKVTLSQYGWTDKLFRVANVVEEKYTDGNLGTRQTAFEYNETIYADNSIQDFIPEMNTGLADPNILSAPGTPTFTTVVITTGTIDNFTVNSVVPALGSILYMDFNYGSTSTTANHILYRTQQQADGTPFANSSTVSVTVNDLPTGDYYWSTTARNNQAGRTSTSSVVFNWQGQFVVGGATPATGSITPSSFPPDLKPVTLVPTIPVGGTEGDVILLESGNYEIYRYTGSTWTAAVSAVNITGQITETQIANNAVTTNKILLGAVSQTSGTQTTNTITLANATTTTITATTITSDGVNPIQILAICDGATTFALPVAGTSTTRVGLFRGNTEIVGYTYQNIQDPWQFTRYFNDAQSTGTYTYSIRVNANIDPLNTGTLVRDVYYSGLQVQQLKR